LLLVLPLTTPWPLALAMTPPLGVKPLGKVTAPVWLTAPAMFGTAPLIG
jgi:hypothetical protein